MSESHWTDFIVSGEGQRLKSEEPRPKLPDGLYVAQIRHRGDPPDGLTECEVYKRVIWFRDLDKGRRLPDWEVIIRVRRVGDLPD